MSSWLPFLGILVCPLVMGLMMLALRKPDRPPISGEDDTERQR